MTRLMIVPSAFVKRAVALGIVGALAALAWPLSLTAQLGAPDGQWPYYGGDAGSTRYSALDQINADNVGDLEVAWRWKAANFGPSPEFNYRATPLMVDGILYVTAGYRRTVAAIDGETGETLWTYRLDEGDRAAPRRNSGRGVAYWQPEGEAARIFVVSPGFHLVALDAATGAPVPGFGSEGIVDLREDLFRDDDTTPSGQNRDLDREPIGSSSPPMIIGDVVILGSALPSGGAPPAPTMPPGWVRGYDAKSGALVWTFHTIPQAGEVGNDTWKEDSWRYSGNAAVWTALSADQELGYVYLPVEAATGDYYGGHRIGDNLFTQSIVALDGATGERAWHFQTVRHGVWDYDPPAAPILADVTVDGQPIPVVAQVTKQSFTYVLDRRTGEPVWPIEDRPVGQTDVPGEQTAETQPFPTAPPPFDRQGVDPDDLIDFTPELRAEAEEILAQLRYGPLYTPPSLVEEGGTQGTLSLPGSFGGANWPGGALDPETGLLYVQSSTAPSVLGLVSDPDVSTMDYIRGGDFRMPRGGGPQGLPLLRPPWGRITALDLNRGTLVWQVPNGDAPDYVKEHPALAGIDVGRTGRPDRGGLLVTKTLLFAGEGGGMFTAYGGGGNAFRAHDKATGEILAEFELPANQTGLPMTYLLQGRQYIVLAVGARGHPGELVALALPDA